MPAGSARTSPGATASTDPPSPVTERGAGFVTASVTDPFGNVLGVMSNPHWAAQTARS
jgi:hypothetical protein